MNSAVHCQPSTNRETPPEAGWDLDTVFGPLLEGLLVVALKCVERRDQRGWQVERVQRFRLASTFLRHLGADVLSKVAELYT